MAINPKFLFEVLLRSHVQANKIGAAAVDAYVMFTVAGKNSGIWTFDLRKKGAHDVLRGKVKDPGLHIMLDEGFLDTFIAGEFDAKKAIADNKLGIVGSEKVFKAFAGFLSGKSAAKLGATKAAAGLAAPKAGKPTRGAAKSDRGGRRASAQKAR
ncbi:MAG: hypothetical protein HY903_20715 [Deltaproteobacteria bacterium]|nr:hypothetical protein [Deltaproteobacteria bacterium]